MARHSSIEIKRPLIMPETSISAEFSDYQLSIVYFLWLSMPHRSSNWSNRCDG